MQNKAKIPHKYNTLIGLINPIILLNDLLDLIRLLQLWLGLQAHLVKNLVLKVLSNGLNWPNFRIDQTISKWAEIWNSGPWH